MDRIAALVEALPPCPVTDKLRAMIVGSRPPDGRCDASHLQRMFYKVRDLRDQDSRTKLEAALEHAMTNARAGRTALP